MWRDKRKECVGVKRAFRIARHPNTGVANDVKHRTLPKTSILSLLEEVWKEWLQAGLLTDGSSAAALLPGFEKPVDTSGRLAKHSGGSMRDSHPLPFWPEVSLENSSASVIPLEALVKQNGPDR